MVNRHHQYVVSLLGLVIYLMCACTPAPPKDELEESMAGEMIAGEMIAGEMIAGEMMAGEMIAGEMIAGEMIAGEMIAGEMMAGEMVAGEMVAGEMVAGEMVAGEMVAGEMVAGEMVAGEMVAGESMAGEMMAPRGCELYCDVMSSQCSTIAQAKWGDDDEQMRLACLERCDELDRLGQAGDLTGESIECLITYASSAQSEESSECFAADPDADRPCFDYASDLSGGGQYEQVLQLGEIARVSFILSERTWVRLLATDGSDCFENDFNLKLSEVSLPLSPIEVVSVDDHDIDQLDFCPVWVGELDGGQYEIEIGTYQDLGASDPFVLSFAEVEPVEIGVACVDPQNRPLTPCLETGECIAGRCIRLLGAGEECSIVGDEPTQCGENLFCYVQASTLDQGQCAPTPSVLNDLCSSTLNHCPVGSSCVLSSDQFRCLDAVCGDGVNNEGEECDDSNLEGGDGCDENCQFETRIPIASPANQKVNYGVIDASSPLWSRVDEDCQLNEDSPLGFHYETRVLTNDTGEAQRLTMVARWSMGDGFLHLYRGDIEAGDLDLLNPTLGCEVGVDDGGLNGTSETVLYEVEIDSGERVTLVLSTFAEGTILGDFELVIRTHGCGDTFLQSGETCDDGNLVDGDGCSAQCETEPACGDGHLDPDEECDDGNLLGGDGCSEVCELEALVGRPILVASEGNITITDSGIFGDAPTWQRPGTFSDPCEQLDEEDDYAFSYFTLKNETGFDQVLDFDLIPSLEFEDLYLHIFQEPFNPNIDSMGCLYGADGGGDRFNDDRLEGISIAAGEQLAIIVSGYDPVFPPLGFPGDFQLIVTTRPAERVDSCELLYPGTLTRVEGEVISVRGVVKKEGVTDLSSGPDLPLVVEIGYGPRNEDPIIDQGRDELERQWIWESAVQESDWDDEATSWVGYDSYHGEFNTVAQGEWDLAIRASLEGQGWTYCDLGPTPLYQIDEAGKVDVLPFVDPSLMINEVDYDQDGADQFEFIELYNPGPALVPLSGLTLEMYDGDSETIYLSLDLSEAGEFLEVDQYLVVGSPLVLLTLAENALGVTLTGAIQNGGPSPDGIRVVNANGDRYDGLSYEGGGLTIEGFGEGNGLIEGDDANQNSGSLSRCPNGEDRDDNRTDFTPVDTSTPGQANECD